MGIRAMLRDFQKHSVLPLGVSLNVRCVSAARQAFCDESLLLNWAGFRHSHIQDLRVILQRCFPNGLRSVTFLIGTDKEVVQEASLAEVVVGV